MRSLLLALLVVTSCVLTPGCEAVKNRLGAAGDWLGSIFSSEPAPPEVRCNPSKELADRMENRELTVIVASNDSQVRSFLETLCIDLGFHVRAPVDLDEDIEAAKDEWFDNLVQDMGDRNELYQGADLVAAAYTTEPMVTNNVKTADGKSSTTTTQTINIDVKFIEIGTKYIAVLAKSSFEKKHFGNETPKVVTARGKLLSGIREAMVPAMLSEGVGSPAKVASYRLEQEATAREASIKQEG